ncbi:hypothetical protein FFLO_03911 [Filobasidium floriforme]|uniref:Glycoside hydrolase family 5 domain-containing protein n=1 Tax=Filobasidium floriforme TaxID=5210 RepID=A0A8K0JJV3_9TREE|nr:hypothetical protein FFLO_03911 [Filobasidium floriforme]
MRASMLKVLGEEKYLYFFDKFLEYFFTESDAQCFASLGLNAIRLPINYRHLEDDMNPRVFKKEGLKHLDRVIELCAKHGIYTIIDLHAAPGAQNTDWHSDLGVHKALFWHYKDFQDRTVTIWEHLAEHYKSNPWVAGYNPLNEPTDPKHTRLVEYYDRIEKAIRKVDDKHILFLDTFGADFSAFMDHPGLPNTVYACHDYSSFGFPNAPEVYTGTDAQKDKLKRSFDRKIQYMKKIGGPIWNGEFGPVYADKSDGPDFEQTNEVRFRVLEDQLQLYDETASSWSIWLWKDIGFQGMVYVDEETAYMKLMKPFLEKKKQLVIDAWGCDDTPVRDLFAPIAEWARNAAPSFKDRYPKTWDEKRFIARLVREILLSEELCDEYASYFKDKTLEELDELAKSFHFDHCQQRTKLNEILRAHKGN